MATEKMEIQVSADVNRAVAGINNLNKTLKQTAASTAPLVKGTNSAAFALTNLGRVAQDAPFGFIGIQNNINPLLESFGRLKQETGSTGAALRALAGSFLGPAGIGVAVSLVTSAITFFVQAQQSAKRETKELKEETSALDTAIKSAVKSVTDESQKVNALVTALQTQNLTREQQKKLIQELNKLAPEYFGNLTKEKNFIDKLSNSYFLYKQSISQAIQAKLLEADLAPLQSRLGEIEKIIKANNDELNLRKAIGASQQVERRGIVLIEGKEVNINELYKRRAGIQAAIFGIQKQINGSNNDYINGLINGNKETKKAVDLLQDYRNSLAAINFTESALGTDLLREKLDLATKTFEDFLNKGIKPNTAAFQFINAEVLKFLNQLPQIKKAADEIQRISKFDPTIILPQRQQPGVNIQRADRTSAVVITPEALKRQTEFAKILDDINAKYLKQLELTNAVSGAINNGINAGIDQFFNAIANNQDPFEALAQSAKRLVVELGAAVVKALALQAISNIIAPGIGAGATGAIGGLFRGTVRGDQLRLLTFLRGG